MKNLNIKQNKDYMRNECIRFWKKNRFKTFDVCPSKEELISFITGFNMGYECNKMKKFKYKIKKIGR